MSLESKTPARTLPQNTDSWPPHKYMPSPPYIAPPYTYSTIYTVDSHSFS